MTAEGERRRPLIAAFASLAAIGFALIVPMIVGGPGNDFSYTSALVRAATHDSYTLSSPVVLVEQPRIVLERGTISVAAGKDGSSKALTALLAGGGADLIVDDATLVLDRSALPSGAGADPSGSPLAETMGPMVAALLARNFDTLVFRHGTLLIKSPDGKEESLRSVTAEVKSKPAGAFEARGSLRLRGEELAFDLAAAPPVGKGHGPVPFRASVRGRLIESSLEGRLVRGERLQIASPSAELSLPKLREVSRWLGVDWLDGEQGPGSFEAKGPLDWSEGSISFENASFMLDGNRATGALSLALGKERPKLEGTLAFDSLDLGPYLSTAAAPSGRTIATDVLSFLRIPGWVSSSLVSEINADLRISARSVAIAGQNLGRCAASLTIKDSLLFADLAEIELDHGGSGEGQVAVDMTGGLPRYSIRGRLESIDVGKVVGDRLGRLSLEGYGTVTVDLSAVGATTTAFLSTLSGKVEVDMPEGARLGLSVERLAKAAESESQSGIWGAAVDGATSIDSLVAKFAALDGVLTAEGVTADTGEKLLTAEGTVSLSERALDVTVSIADETKSAKPDGPGAPEPAPAEGFRVSGPWTAPTLSPVNLPRDGDPALDPGPAVHKPSDDRG
jgi:AsmA protein